MSTPEPLRDAIIRAMIAEVESRTGWDEEPELWRISVRDGQPVLRRIAVPEVLWTRARPPEVLNEIAAAVAVFRYYPGQAEDDAVDGPVYGFGFLHEGWAIESDSTCEALRRDAADAAAHLIHTRPDRVEVRMFSAVDREQNVYAVMRSRGGVMDETMTGTVGGNGPDGAVVDALTRMVKGATHGGAR